MMVLSLLVMVVTAHVKDEDWGEVRVAMEVLKYHQEELSSPSSPYYECDLQEGFDEEETESSAAMSSGMGDDSTTLPDEGSGGEK